MPEATRTLSPAADPPLMLDLLGRFRARLGEDDVTPRGRKTRALLALLALEQGRDVGRERLADLLWSDRGPEQARGSLRQALTELRRGPTGRSGALRLSRDVAALVPEMFDTDLAGIEHAAASDDIERLAELLQAARGELLEDLVDLSPGIDEWLGTERIRRHDRLIAIGLAACARTVEREVAVDLRELLAALERLDPGNEHVARAGLCADHRAADTPALHRRYQRLTRRLADEFGVTPARETRDLFGQLTAAAPVAQLAPVMPHEPVARIPAPVEPPLVMVSPIVALDGNVDTAALAEICTDEIRIALAQHRDLRVVGLAPGDLERARAGAGTAVPGYLLSCKLRRTADAMRLTVQLGQIDTGLVVWSEQQLVDESLLDDAIDRIVARAAGAVHPTVQRDLASVVPQDGEIVILYLRARQRAYAARSFAEGCAAAALLEEVIARDPAHVGARVMLAQLYNTDFWQTVAGHDFAGFRARALTLTREAAALDPGNARVQLRLAWCNLRRGAWELAARGLRETLRALPFDAEAVNEVGLGLCCLGELAAAEAAMQRAFLLHPFPPATHHADYAVLLGLRGDADAAEEHFDLAGEVGLFYRAHRLANLARRAPHDRGRELAARFAADFAAIWQRPEAPTVVDMLDWTEACLNLRDDAQRDGVRSRLQSMLAAIA